MKVVKRELEDAYEQFDLGDKEHFSDAVVYVRRHGRERTRSIAAED